MKQKTATLLIAATLSAITLCSYAPGVVPTSENRKADAHFVGELFGGGIIYSVTKSADGAEHGMIVSLKDLSDGTEWSNNTRLETMAKSTTDGRANTAAILKAGTPAKYPAGLCDAYAEGEFKDWYLPAIDELKTIYSASAAINKTVEGNPKAQILDARWCWSSTEDSRGAAMGFSFLTGESSMSNKLRNGSVRAVRAF